MREVITTDGAPTAIGPYSQAIRCGGFLFVSGQIALDPITGDLIGAEVGAQTEQVLKNAGEILMAAGSTLELVVRDFIAEVAGSTEHPTGEAPRGATLAKRPPLG